MGLVSHMERAPKAGPVRAFLDWWDASGPFAIVVVTGVRDDAAQLAEYAKGRKQLPDGSWVVVDHAALVTNAMRSADSAHGHVDGGVDCQPVRAFYGNGLPRLVYLGNEAELEVREEARRRLKVYDELAREHGLETGENYPGLCDRPHICDKNWRKLPLVSP